MLKYWYWLTGYFTTNVSHGGTVDKLSPELVWLLIGIVLIIVELLSGTFFFIFIGVGALITAACAMLGMHSIPVQIVVFCATSIVLILILRRTAKKLFFGHQDLPPDFIGQHIKVVKEIPARGEGYVMYRGSHWIAFSDSDQNIPEGNMVEVVDHLGIKLKVVPVK